MNSINEIESGVSTSSPSTSDIVVHGNRTLVLNSLDLVYRPLSVKKNLILKQRKERRLQRRLADEANAASWQEWRSRSWDWWNRNYPELVAAFHKRFSPEQRREKRKILYKNHHLAEHLLAAYNRQRSNHFATLKRNSDVLEHNNALKNKFLNNRFSFLKNETNFPPRTEEPITFGSFETSTPHVEIQLEERLVTFSRRRSPTFKHFGRSDECQSGTYVPKYASRTEEEMQRLTCLQRLVRSALTTWRRVQCNNSLRYCYTKITCGKCNFSFKNLLRLGKVNEGIPYGVEVDTSIPIYGEMDTEGTSDPHGNEEVVQDQASNVILTDEPGSSQAITTIPQFKTWSEYCSSESRTDYDKLVNRWMKVASFEWNKDHTRQTILKQIVLPRDYVLSDKLKLCDVPNSLPFHIHRYWRGDMEIKIQINSNRFQVGSLQCAWLYQPHLDLNIGSRDNMYVLSQTNHVIVNANTSNEGVLYIPYKYYVPLLHTKPRNDMSHPLNLGTLYITVLNPLVTAAASDSKCFVTVFAKCVNNEFTGMLSGDIDPIKSEMNNIGRSLGELALNSLFPDTNRDNPPIVTAPRYLVPTASHSWSVGTGLNEPLHPLRLDGRGQTPHPPGIDVTDEMEINKIVRTFGLLGQLKWSKDLAADSMLYNVPVMPLLDKNQYKKVKKDDDLLVAYFVPPVGVISSMFMSWRGTLEFKFDIVASSYHTGRLMVGYVPGILHDHTRQLTIDQLRCSTNTTFSITDTGSFTYSVPFISNKPVWPRRYAGDYESQDSSSPAWLYMFIVNPLIPMSSVSNEIEINIYMRAGPDFEVMVPVQPAIGLSWNRNFISPNKRPVKIKAVVGYDPWYVGSFEDFTHACVLRWGQYSHQIAHFDGSNYWDPASHTISYCVLIEPAGSKIPMYNDGTQKLGFCVFTYVNQLGYIVGIPSPTEEQCKTLASHIHGLKLSINDEKNIPFVISNSLHTTNNTFGSLGLVWDVKTFTWTPPKPPTPDPPKVIGQIGEQNQSSNLLSTGLTNTMQQGYLIYGERFFSLKDLARRYQFYTHIRTKFDITSNMEMIKARFPVVPIGLNLVLGTTDNINELSNRLREGHIPIISSGYRYYRGGLRFRLVANTKINAGYTIAIQHRPDRQLRSYSVTAGDGIIDGNSVMNHTYSSYLQYSIINNIIEFEIPFYIMGMYGLLQQASFKNPTDESLDYYSLGDLNVSIISEKSSKEDLRLDVFYSIADDMSFSTFQGFPLVVFCNDVPPQTIQPPKPKVDSFEIINHEMGLWDVFNVKKNATDAVQEGIENAAVNSFNVISEQVKGSVEKALEDVKNKFNEVDFGNHELLVLMGLEILHLINHKDLTTLALVVIKILIHFKMIVVNNIMSSVQTLVTMLKSWLSRQSSDQLRAEESLPEIHHEMDCKDILLDEWEGVVSMLYAGVSAALSIKTMPKFDFNNFNIFLTRTVPAITRGSNFLIGFFSVIGKLVSRISRYIICKVYPLEGFYHCLNEEMPTIKKWVDEVLYLDSLDLETRVSDREVFKDRIFAAYLFGQRIMVHFADNREAHLIIKFFDIIKKKYNLMVELGNHPFIRKEPFVLWVSGATRIGKSFLTEHLAAKMLRSINLSLEGNSRIYTIMPTNEFWSGCRQQPVLVMDDAFSVELPVTVERTLNYMYMIKSSCTLNPPQAHLDQKHHRYNPEIFYINSNKSFINLANVDPTAVHSRRDVLVKAEVIDPERPRADLYSKEERRNFGHLNFYTARDVNNTNTQWDGPFNYEEFSELLCRKYKDFYNKENDAFNFRLSTYDGCGFTSDEDILHGVSLEDEIQRLKDFLIDEYEAAKENCFYQKCKEYAAITRSWTNTKIEQLFNRFTNITIQGEMDIPASTSSTTPVTPVTEGITPPPVAEKPLTTAQESLKKMWPEAPVRLLEEHCDKLDQIFKARGDRPHLLQEDDIFTSEGAIDIMKIHSNEHPWYIIHYVCHKLPLRISALLRHAYDDFEIPSCVDKDTLYTTYRKEYISTAYLKQTRLPRWQRYHNTGLLEILNKKYGITTSFAQDEDSMLYPDFTYDKFFKRLLGFGIQYSDKLILPFKAAIDGIVDYNIVAIVMSCVQSIVSTKRIRCFDKLWLYLEPVLSFFYPACNHLGARVVWDTDSLTFIKNRKDVGDGPCHPTACIHSEPLIWHLFAVSAVVKNTCSFMFLKKNNSTDLLPRCMRTGLPGAELKKQMDEWSETFCCRALDFIFKKIPKIIYNILRYMCLIGGLISAFIVSYITISGIVHASICGFNYMFGTTIQSASSSAKTASIGSTVKETNNPQLPKNSPYVLGEGSGGYANQTQHVVNPQVHIIPQSSRENFTNILRLIENNSFFLECEYVNRKNQLSRLVARGIKISGHHALMVKHYFEEFDAIIKKQPNTIAFYYVTKETKSVKLEIDYKLLKFKYLTHEDPKYGSNFVFVQLPPQVPMGRDIRNLFMTVEGHHLAGTTGSVYEFGVGHHLNLNTQFCGPFQISGTDVQSAVYVAHAYSYGIHGRGMCGSVLLTNINTTSPVIGMHVAGGGQHGYAEPIYREMFDNIRDGLHGFAPTTPDEILHIPINHEIKPAVMLETTIFEEGCVEKTNAHVETGQTSYVPSLIQGSFPVTTEPNPLKYNDPRLPTGTSPMKAGCELMGHPVKLLDNKILDRATNDLEQLILNVVPPVKRISILTLEEAICGIADIKYYESLNWNTSPGFGFKDTNKVKKGGKKFLFDLEETTTGFKLKKGEFSINKKLLYIMDAKQNCRNHHIVPPTIFVDCLKDTCINVDKCKIPGKTRIFSISPVDFTIQFKQYFGDFIASYTQARFAAEHAIGISVNGPDWSDLANHLHKYEGEFVTGDYKNFGPGLSLQVANKAFDIIISWYKFNGASSYHLDILDIMRYEVVGARHLCLNFLYMVCSGIPSGSPITAPLNSLSNCIYLRYAYFTLLHPQIFSLPIRSDSVASIFNTSSDLHQFSNNVILVTLGDDLIMKVKKEIIDQFNFSTIAQVFGRFNIRFTAADKSEVVVRSYPNLTGLSFLSCTFNIHPNRSMHWLASLKIESVYGCANWIHKKGDRKDNTRVNAVQAGLLAYGHGKDVYEVFTAKLQLACRTHNVPYHKILWEDYDDMFFGSYNTLLFSPIFLFDNE